MSNTDIVMVVYDAQGIAVALHTGNRADVEAQVNVIKAGRQVREITRLACAAQGLISQPGLAQIDQALSALT